MKKITWILSFLTLISTSVILQFMPDEIPTHYDINGNIDSYGSKYLYLIIPVIIIATTAFLSFLGNKFKKTADSSDDEKTVAEANSNAKVCSIVSLAVTILFSVTLFAALYNAYISVNAGIEYLEIDELKLTTVLLGVFLIVIGNYLPKTKLNGNIGLRISYSMYNDNTWKKSNRFAAIAIMIAGALSIVTTVFVNGMLSVIMLLCYLFAAIIVIVIYAHKVYDEEVKKNT